MKTSLAFIVIVMCCFILPGCSDDDSSDTVKHSTDVETSEDVESYVQALDFSQDWTEEFVEVLKSIKDEQSLQAALPRIEELGRQRNDYLILADEMQPPSRETNAMLVSTYGEQIASLQEQMTDEMLRIAILGDEVADPLIKAIDDILNNAEVKELPAWLEPHKP